MSARIGIKEADDAPVEESKACVTAARRASSSLIAYTGVYNIEEGMEKTLKEIVTAFKEQWMLGRVADSHEPNGYVLAAYLVHVL